MFEVRFRQAQYSVESSYPIGEAVIEGRTYTFEQNLNSKIFMDGLKLSFGIAYYFK
jgi:hypothetical protein